MAHEDLIRLAIERIGSDIAIPPEVKPIIEENEDTYIVIFPTNLEPGVRGPDYHAKVVINKNTKKIIKVLVGS